MHRPLAIAVLSLVTPVVATTPVVAQPEIQLEKATNGQDAAPLPSGVTQVANQGNVSGSNFASAQTDDPSLPGAADPTVTAVSSSSAVEIPTLRSWALLALALAMGFLGLRRVARS